MKQALNSIQRVKTTGIKVILGNAAHQKRCTLCTDLHTKSPLRISDPGSRSRVDLMPAIPAIIALPGSEQNRNLANTHGGTCRSGSIRLCILLQFLEVGHQPLVSQKTVGHSARRVALSVLPKLLTTPSVCCVWR
jgi:hypothetical protein